MPSCTFFGHRDTPNEIAPALKEYLTYMIENKKVDLFYVGNQGHFDQMVRRILKELKVEYPHIRYAVVLAYIPQTPTDSEDFSDTVYPEGLENVPRKHAIYSRNLWLINNSEYVIAYVRHNFGGAAKFTELAKKKGKTVYNLFLPG